MQDMQIKDIVLAQKAELADKIKEFYIARSTGEIELDSPVIKVITGPRRAGKSFFAMHLLAGKNIKFGYLNFDDERVVSVTNYDDFVTAINEVYDNPTHILFDEIQNLPRWELFVARIARGGKRLVITGSNSNLLSRELATHLTGRHIEIKILPFSFKEYVRLDGNEDTESELKGKLSRYILTGGFPEPIVKKLNFKEYLSILVNSIIYKDIVKRYRVKSVAGIEDLSSYLFSNIAAESSFNRLSTITKVKSSHTVEKYLSYLEEAYLFFHLKRFSYKVREQLASNRKIYCIDNGLISSKAFRISSDIGKLYENTVARELIVRAANYDSQIYYYKNAQQEEVDFAVKRATAVTDLIQVSYDITNSETHKREVRALVKAGEELECTNLVIINNDVEKTEEVEWFGLKGTIKYLPLYKWLLENKTS